MSGMYIDLCREQDELIAKLKRENATLVAIGEELAKLRRDNAALLAASKYARDIIDVFMADQSGAKDPRCGLVQPVTVEDCNELGRVFNLLGIVIAEAES